MCSLHHDTQRDPSIAEQHRTLLQHLLAWRQAAKSCIFHRWAAEAKQKETCRDLSAFVVFRTV